MIKIPNKNQNLRLRLGRGKPRPFGGRQGYLNMDNIYGKVFKLNDENEFGIIRKAIEPYPHSFSGSDVLAEDECGNYFILKNQRVVFWDHETSEELILANDIEEFITGCTTPTEATLESGQVESTWVDPEFAKKFGI